MPYYEVAISLSLPTPQRQRFSSTMSLLVNLCYILLLCYSHPFRFSSVPNMHIPTTTTSSTSTSTSTSTLDHFLEILVPDDVPLLGVAALILLYVLVASLVVDFIRTDPEDVVGAASASGMSAEELKESPCFEYGGGGDHKKAGSSSCCAICLDGFESGESCRVFPVCKHVYHTPCIDPWLLKNVSCPTCRSRFKTRSCAL